VTASPADVVHDFDFHPNEPFVRVFTVPRSSVLRLDDAAFVSESRIGDVVLRHYAFGHEWFKVNVTFDPEGTLIETPAGPDHPAFAFNCDIATPMRRKGDSVDAIDLCADVLVRKDGRSSWIKDEDDLAQAAASGLISRHEFASARAGLDRLTTLIDAGALLAFLEAACPFGPSHAPDALPMTRLPLADVPQVQPERRWTWHPPT
jgi:hypothetical protein